MSRPKTARLLGWAGRLPFYHPETVTVRLSLVDNMEPDRIHLLVLRPDQAAELGRHLSRVGGGEKMVGP